MPISQHQWQRHGNYIELYQLFCEAHAVKERLQTIICFTCTGEPRDEVAKNETHVPHPKEVQPLSIADRRVLRCLLRKWGRESGLMVWLGRMPSLHFQRERHTGSSQDDANSSKSQLLFGIQIFRVIKRSWNLWGSVLWLESLRSCVLVYKSGQTWLTS